MDGDGDLDLAVARSGLFYVNHAARDGLANWIKVRPLTSRGGQSAFGTLARVTCVAGASQGWVGVRTVDGGSARYSQSAYDAHFGLPDPDGVYNVSVAWVGGNVSDWSTPTESAADAAPPVARGAPQPGPGPRRRRRGPGAPRGLSCRARL